MTKNSDNLAWLEELNPEQRKAVTHEGSPLLVVAGAGSGKTKTLAYRVAYLIAQGIPAEKILLLTFTRRAAQEMLKRASEITERGTALLGRTWGGTFHATANGHCSRFEYAQYVLNKLSIEAPIEPCSLKDLPEGQHTPANCLLENRYTRKQGNDAMVDWKADLDRFLEESGEELIEKARNK